MYPDKGVTTQIAKKTKVSKIFPRQERAIAEGEKFAIPIETELSDAGGHRNETDDVPVPDRVKGQFGYSNYPIYERTVRLTGKSRKTGGSVVEPLKREVQGLVQAAALDTERDLFLSSRGEHATCVSASDSTTLLVDSWQYLTKGMRIDVLIATSGSDGGIGITNSKITNVSRNLTNGQATLTLATPLKAYGSIDSTYGVFRTNEWNKKGWSILDAVDASNPTAGNYLEIDRSAEPLWAAYEVDAQGQSASGPLFASVQTMLEIDSDDPAGVILVHPFTENDLISRGVIDKIYIGAKKVFELWGERITINGTPVVGVKHCPFDTGLFLNLDYWEMSHPPAMNSEGEWDRDGYDEGSRFNRVANKWAHEALWVRMRQLICRRPNAQAKLTNIGWHYQGTVS
jgi:hypothetical protein